MVSQAYQKFKLTYDIISKEIGNTVISECLAFKVHREVMSFEAESEENLNVMKSLELKDRYQFQIKSGQNTSNKVILE